MNVIFSTMAPKYIMPKKLSSEDFGYTKKTYTEVNYFAGLSSFFRKRHFSSALRITKLYFNTCNVIDFGCADGPFFPSLSKYFKQVIGIDNNYKMVRIAKKLVEVTNLNNVEIINNDKLDIHQIKTIIKNKKIKIIYLLETLEHIGDKENLYDSQMLFLNDLFQLLNDKGFIVITIPKMFGFTYFFQILGLRLLGQQLDLGVKHTLIDLIKKTFYLDVEKYEQQWNHGHEGYNYRKLEQYLINNFNMIKKQDLIFQMLYVIKKT